MIIIEPQFFIFHYLKSANMTAKLPFKQQPSYYRWLYRQPQSDYTDEAFTYVHTHTHTLCDKSLLLQCDQTAYTNQDSPKIDTCPIMPTWEKISSLYQQKYPQNINKVTSTEIHESSSNFRMSMCKKQSCIFHPGSTLYPISHPISLFILQP